MSCRPRTLAAAAARVVVQARRPDGRQRSGAARRRCTTRRARLRAAGLHVETIDGMRRAPTHRLICRAGAPRFTLTTAPDASARLRALDDVVAALERGALIRLALPTGDLRKRHRGAARCRRHRHRRLRRGSRALRFDDARRRRRRARLPREGHPGPGRARQLRPRHLRPRVGRGADAALPRPPRRARCATCGFGRAVAVARRAPATSADAVGAHRQRVPEHRRGGGAAAAAARAIASSRSGAPRRRIRRRTPTWR